MTHKMFIYTHTHTKSFPNFHEHLKQKNVFTYAQKRNVYKKSSYHHNWWLVTGILFPLQLSVNCFYFLLIFLQAGCSLKSTSWIPQFSWNSRVTFECGFSQFHIPTSWQPFSWTPSFASYRWTNAWRTTARAVKARSSDDPCGTEPELISCFTQCFLHCHAIMAGF